MSFVSVRIGSSDPITLRSLNNPYPDRHTHALRGALSECFLVVVLIVRASPDSARGGLGPARGVPVELAAFFAFFAIICFVFYPTP